MSTPPKPPKPSVPPRAPELLDPTAPYLTAADMPQLEESKVTPVKAPPPEPPPRPTRRTLGPPTPPAPPSPAPPAPSPALQPPAPPVTPPPRAPSPPRPRPSSPELPPSRALSPEPLPSRAPSPEPPPARAAAEPPRTLASEPLPVRASAELPPRTSSPVLPRTSSPDLPRASSADLLPPRSLLAALPELPPPASPALDILGSGPVVPVAVEGRPDQLWTARSIAAGLLLICGVAALAYLLLSGQLARHPFWLAGPLGAVVLGGVALLGRVRRWQDRKPMSVTGFVGPRPLTRADREQYGFFGRELETEHAVDKLRNPATRCLVLSGESGCGKTSLLLAGVIPRLESELGCRCIYVAMDDKPVWALRQALRLAAGRAVTEPGTTRLKDELEQAQKRAGRPVVLFVDQFEEFGASPVSSEDHLALIELFQCVLGGPLAVLPDVQLVFSVRSDQLALIDDLTRSAGSATAGSAEARLALQPLELPAAREIIDELARRSGLRLEWPLGVVLHLCAAEGPPRMISRSLAQLAAELRVRPEVLVPGLHDLAQRHRLVVQLTQRGEQGEPATVYRLALPYLIDLLHQATGAATSGRQLSAAILRTARLRAEYRRGHHLSRREFYHVRRHRPGQLEPASARPPVTSWTDERLPYIDLIGSYAYHWNQLFGEVRGDEVRDALAQALQSYLEASQPQSVQRPRGELEPLIRAARRAGASVHEVAGWLPDRDSLRAEPFGL